MGVDRSSQTHRVFVIDHIGRKLGERGFAHGGEGPAEMAAWINRQTGTAPDAVSITIKAPHGSVEEGMTERDFRAHAIDPRQLDRLPPVSTEDDSRDAHVFADALLTDLRCLRRPEPYHPVMVGLCERHLIGDDLRHDRNRPVALRQDMHGRLELASTR